MNIDRYMVNLFFEIKRNLPFELRSPLKISNANLCDDLIDVYLSIDNEANQRLIEVFLERAGETWGKKLCSARIPSLDQNADQPGISNIKQPLKSIKKARYYRGVLVE